MSGIDIGLIITFVTAVTAAYLGFRHQQRLKAFELFLARRERVLDEVAKEIERLQDMLDSLEAQELTVLSIFRHNLVLFHRMKGCAFGKTADIMVETFWTVAKEPVDRGSPLDDPEAWLGRMLNCLSAFHAFGHSELSREMRYLSLPFVLRISDSLSRWKSKWQAARKERELARHADRESDLQN